MGQYNFIMPLLGCAFKQSRLDMEDLLRKIWEVAIHGSFRRHQEVFKRLTDFLGAQSIPGENAPHGKTPSRLSQRTVQSRCRGQRESSYLRLPQSACTDGPMELKFIHLVRPPRGGWLQDPWNTL
jgi:hypothetical protein